MLLAHEDDDEGPPEGHISGYNALAQKAVWALVCGCVCVVLVWVVVFVLLCVLLARNNTPEVHAACGGFWDFMLVSILSPILIPAAYCILTCGVWARWSTFTCAACLIMACASLQMSLGVSERRACLDALGDPPLLLYAGYVKAIMYCVGSISTLFGEVALVLRH